MKFIFFAPVISLNLALSSLTNDTKISILRVTLLKINLVSQLCIYLDIVPEQPSKSKKSSLSRNFNILGKTNQSVRTVSYSYQHICSFFAFVFVVCLSVPFQSLRDEGYPFSSTFIILHILYIYYLLHILQMAGEKLLPRVKLLTEWRLTIELQPNLSQLQSTTLQGCISCGILLSGT